MWFKRGILACGQPREELRPVQALWCYLRILRSLVLFRQTQTSIKERFKKRFQKAEVLVRKALQPRHYRKNSLEEFVNDHQPTR